jgi:hypothetical protein
MNQTARSHGHSPTVAPPQQPQLGSATLADLLSSRYAPVQENLLKMLSPREEARLNCVSKDLRKGVMAFRNWDNILEKFFSDAKAFRSFQAKVNGILTGDIVIDFFARTKHFILDDPVLIFIVDQDDMEAAREFLENDGFVKDDNYVDNGIGYDGINQVFEHPHRSTGVKVHLCGGFDSLMSALLFGNYMALNTTLSLNIITWNKAYSVFPSLSFVDKTAFSLEYDTTSASLLDNVGRWHRRIAAAGYKIKDISWSRVQDPSLARRRRMCDKHTWVIDLPTQEITASPVPDGAIASTTFAIVEIGPGFDEATAGYLKSFDRALSSPVLRHEYVTHYSKNSAYEAKIEFVKARLLAQTYMELGKLELKDRPPRFSQIKDHPEILKDDQFWANVTKPSWWTYYDDDVIEFLDRLEAEYGEEESKVKEEWEEEKDSDEEESEG